jgi:hypothetical protein
MNQTSNKKDQFINQRKSKAPIIIGIVTILIVSVLTMAFLNINGKKEELTYYGDPVVGERSYIGKLIKMTKIEPIVDEESLQIPLETVDQSNIVYFESENQDKAIVPMMAYITPSGRLFVGSSLCEPCRGKTFSLAGETLVCDTCKTTYNIENHEFISGAKVCGQYPPVNMNPEIIDGNIVIQKEEVLNWKIRAN